MESRIDRANSDSTDCGKASIKMPRIDANSVIFALAASVGFFALAMLSLSLSKFDSTLASVWVPNAFAVALLLRARVANSIPFYLGVFIASILSNTLSGTPIWIASIFSIANLVDIAIVVAVARGGGSTRPDMTQLPDLARFVWAGGLVGPASSAAIASLAMAMDSGSSWTLASSWLLTDAMGMILIVPASLLAYDAWQQRAASIGLDWVERITLLGGGMACAFLVFRQDAYPLLFLIPPIALLHAFRLGSLGTALYVFGLAIVASVMTWAGFGPIEAAGLSPTAQVHIVQAFIAANFLTGLPVAAILAGRQRIVEDLADGKRQLDLLAGNITDAVLRYDIEGRCTYASPSVRDVLNAEPEIFVGQFATDRMHQDARERISLAQHRLVSRESEKERFTYRRFLDAADGSAVYIEAECGLAFNPESGEAEGIVVSARDVTERVELELLLTRARHHAENAVRAKSEFLANMSHEIRTPMNGVLGFAELMLQSDLDDDQRRQTEMIVQSGRSMMLLLNDILDLSKIEAGQISIDQAAIDLHETLEECTALHMPNAEKKGLGLRLEREAVGDGSDESASGWVMTDGLRLRQIVLNLIGNAVKFTESGTIDVVYSVDDDQFSVRVVDTGIGISSSRLESVFHPFTQEESNTARRFGGTGLGLTISRQLAELLGGFIDVESEAGVGSCFTLTLPAKRAAPARRPAPESTPITLADLPHHARILLAEDHDVNRMLATEMLERCGQSVALAHDGNEAISMVIDSMMRGSPYDLVLMDIQMPGCDGYAATRAIRAEGIGPDILPIIALTANAFPEDVAAARDAGMQSHLAKPFVFSEIARALQRWLPTRILEIDAEVSEPPIAFERTDADGDRNSAIHSAAAPAPSTPHNPSELTRRWLMRREEAVEAVRLAARDGTLENGVPRSEREQLTRLVHKLAGTAAMFGEEDLGQQASALERALRSKQSSAVQKALAEELLELADRGSSEQFELQQA
ncbi:PAS domain-containing hybrid sensor histidine kinase/response regulator [Erythrobacter crassostreae]|uniref:Sensory/regulatory protein RpfC n=1 Tax=Erythrobacter crassostreae TaxID=2828328 RepID=A0A9X1F2C4_9SPHN|nr:PAS domain-containing hybrid sensor histidine kinase/response regulator [Erythrobacter crassostrea]MBV7259017.1 response regulator [Erythrobacter crassostrea]